MMRFGRKRSRSDERSSPTEQFSKGEKLLNTHLEII